MNMTYRQCHLERRNGNVTLHHTSWLPAPHAVVGHSLRLREADGSWSAPWRVTFASETTLSEAATRHAERAHLKQRKASDL